MSACGENVKPQKPLWQDLSQALSDKSFIKVSQLKNTVQMSNVSLDLINAFLTMHGSNIVLLQHQLSQLDVGYVNMSLSQKLIFEEMQKWLNLKNIYREEISPPVRILQREQLYLAPSNISFTLCPSSTLNCASKARNVISSYMTNEEIIISLKRMALKDPCVNLSHTLQGKIKANRCLQKSKGGLAIELLSKPRFNVLQWNAILR